MRDIFRRDPDADLRREMTGIFQNYENWINSLQIPLPAMKKGILPGDFSATIEKGSRKIGVVGLNSTFLQIGSGDYKSKLDVHVSQLLDVCQNDPDRWLQSHDIGLLLMHHPIHWLSSESQKHFRDEIYPPDRFHALLCGHQHDPSQTDISEGGASPRHYRQGPSLFGLEKYGQQNDQTRRHGYNIGQFEFENNRGWERIWPRDAVEALSGGRRLCPDQRYELTDEDCVVTVFDVENVAASTSEVQSEALTNGIVPSVPSESTKEPQLRLLDQIPDIATSIKELAGCSRFAISPVPQHCAVRLDEQRQFENALRQDRIVWVKSDWATGIEGFLSASLDRFRKQPPEPTVFRLHCEDATDTDQFETLFPQQFGMSLQRFCAVVTPVPATFFILSDVHPALVSGTTVRNFKRILDAIIDYCPNLRMICTSISDPQDLKILRVDLRPLEPPDVRTYLLNHPDAADDIKDPDAVEKIHDSSDGLPLHIDRILRALKVTSLKSVLEAEREGVQSGQVLIGNVPKALVEAVDSLESSSDRQCQRSLKLLKVLSILPYGETIDSIKRFLPTEPFFISHAVQLNELGLLDVIPLNPSGLKVPVLQSIVAESIGHKLLKVPRQVRDYVQSLLTEDERRSLCCAGADLYFGRRWRNGKIKPREVPEEYREYLDNRPGNEFAIIHNLFQDVRANSDGKAAKKIAELATYYCRCLRHKDRFRDLLQVADGILQVVDADTIPEHWAEIAYFNGLAMRMTGKREEAIECLRHILCKAEVSINNEVKASIWLNIALGEQSLKNLTKATEAAQEVKKLCGEKTTLWFQANCIIESVQSTGKERLQKLSELSKEARSRNMTVVANNLDLELAHSMQNPKDKVNLLNAVLNEEGDSYNKTRAIAEKTRLTEDANTCMKLSLSDRLMLSESYSYTHSQRFSSLFNACHEGLWKVLQESGDVEQLLRLFRHSSFIWRIRGEEGREAEYAQKLSVLKPPEESASPAKVILLEVRYFWRRLRAVSISVVAR